MVPQLPCLLFVINRYAFEIKYCIVIHKTAFYHYLVDPHGSIFHISCVWGWIGNSQWSCGVMCLAAMIGSIISNFTFVSILYPCYLHLLLNAIDNDINCIIRLAVYVGCKALHFIKHHIYWINQQLVYE